METGRTPNRRAGQQPKAPKIRLSCDSCQASKIRCGQERPACRRCVKYNIDCVYSPSRRAGRPRPRKTEQPAQPQTAPPQTALPTPNTASPPRELSYDHDTIVVAAAPPACAAASSSGPPRHFIPSITPAAAATCGPSPTSGPSADTSTSPHPSTISISDFLYKEQQRSPPPPPPPPPPSTGHDDDSEPQQQCQDDADPFSSMLFPDFASSACQQPASAAGLLHHDDSALTFDFMLSPTMQDCGNNLLPGPGAGAETPSVDYLLRGCGGDDSGSSSSALSASSSTESSSFDHAMHDVSDVGGGECLCAATLLLQLAESPPSSCCARDGDNSSASLATAVQKSKALLDHCFRVLCCAQCGPRLSSALMLCQAMDGVSMALGMGTLWGGDGVGAETDAGAGATRGDLSSILARDEAPLRCGTYSVRGADRRVVLRALIMKRLAEMQSAMSKLQQAVSGGAAANEACQSTCAGMVVELRGKVTSKIDLFKVLL